MSVPLLESLATVDAGASAAIVLSEWERLVWAVHAALGKPNDNRANVITDVVMLHLLRCLTVADVIRDGGDPALVAALRQALPARADDTSERPGR